MSDVMLFGVLRMPPDLWRDDPLDKAQRHSRYLEAADEIERLRARVAELTLLLREAREGCVGIDPGWLGSDSQQSWCHAVDAAIGLPFMKESGR